MESWFQRIFLKFSCLLLMLVVATAAIAQEEENLPEETAEESPQEQTLEEEVIAEEDDDEGYSEYDENSEETILDAVISPDLKRRVVREDRLDSENFEFGAFNGVYSLEDFGTNNVTGARASYHISEDFFIEGVYGETEASQSAVELLLGTDFFQNSDNKLIYYHFSFGVNLFPGEIFIGKNYAFNSSYYVILGVGDTEFVNQNYFTFNFGGGYRIYATDWLALNLDFRNHVFTHNVFGRDKSIQNLETHLGLSIFF